MTTSKSTTNKTHSDQSTITRNISNNALAKTSTEPEAGKYSKVLCSL